MNEITIQKIEFACESGTTPGYLAQPIHGKGLG